MRVSICGCLQTASRFDAIVAPIVDKINTWGEQCVFISDAETDSAVCFPGTAIGDFTPDDLKSMVDDIKLLTPYLAQPWFLFVRAGTAKTTVFFGPAEEILNEYLTP